jgi:glutathione S-transferase
MLTLYDNPFSPFARKVRLVLHYKQLEFNSIDALALEEHEALTGVNPRAEVPVLVDGEVVVRDSTNIVAYLEDRYPAPSILPSSAALRAKAREWQRLADTVFDAVIHDISIWAWPTHRRRDDPPEGLVEAGRRDLALLIGRLEAALGSTDFLCGELSLADLALFPHVSSLKPVGVLLEPDANPNTYAWNRRMRLEPCVTRDLDHVRRAGVERFIRGPSPYESEKIVWRGDRLEWLFLRGFHAWWLSELAAGRAVIPSSV